MSRACKVVVVGDGCVGKSSMIARLVSEGFNACYGQTIGVDFYEKFVGLRGGLRLEIWDIGGQSLNSKMLCRYASEARCVLIVYDVTNRESLENAEDWLATIEGLLGNKATYFLVGNKADLLRDRQVSKQDHDRFLRERPQFSRGFLVSAASGDMLTRPLYQAAFLSLGTRLTDNELAIHDKVLTVTVDTDNHHDEHRLPDADRIEAEDLEAERRMQRRLNRRCACTLS